MGIESLFADLMPATVTVYPRSAIDQYGKRSWSASGTSYSCRIQADTGVMRDAEGREVVITGRAYLYGAPVLTTDHKIVLPDGSSPVIVSVATVEDEDGPHHTMIRFGR